MSAGIDHIDVDVRRFPTPTPHADGTLEWRETVAVTVELRAGAHVGTGWTYSSPVSAALIRDHLADVVRGRPVSDVSAGWEAMHRAGRNFGTRGLYLQAMSAVDIAWWDLKARLLGVGLADLFGRCRDAVPLYGSGGFTSMSDEELAAQVRQWQGWGCSAMKIKIGQAWGARTSEDLRRIELFTELAGPAVTPMVDANGAYTLGQARRIGRFLDDLGVTWFEEPVSSDDLAGLALLRAALRCDVTAGEYLAEISDAAAMAPVVDCLQLDATRCGGYTGWLRLAALAQAANRQVSAHCAPALHLPVAAAVSHLRHIEYFADHVALEPELADGVPSPANGTLPVSSGPGHGMTLRAQ